jgi:arsenate reductase
MFSKPKVLFLCTGNSCRSQMAEGFLRHVAGDTFDVFSAGTDPVGVNPDAVRVMAEKGVDISGQESKGVKPFLGRHFTCVVTVCDRASERCPIFPGVVKRIHWSFDDPAHATGTEEEKLAVFRRVRDEVEAHVRRFVSESATGVPFTGDIEAKG